MTFKQTLSNKLVIFGLFALFLFLGNLKYKQWHDEQSIQNNIQQLEKEQQDKQQKSNDLSQSLQYLSSSEFKEKVAREQLGYKRTGETLYGFTDPQPGEQQVSQPIAQIGNPQKWWNYFFSQ